VDVDELNDVCQQANIECMPTFVFYRNEKEVERFTGANAEKLEEVLMKNINAAN